MLFNVHLAQELADARRRDLLDAAVHSRLAAQVPQPRRRRPAALAPRLRPHRAPPADPICPPVVRR
jgi:hypothetical protein